ncbi:MAG TPA: hypothetical protein VES96_02385 [Nitrospiraceae bacterium]|nr:hypothetical protein [Nitrospiraceae bacterium]
MVRAGNGGRCGKPTGLAADSGFAIAAGFFPAARLDFRTLFFPFATRFFTALIFFFAFRAARAAGFFFFFFAIASPFIRRPSPLLVAAPI